MFRRLRLALLPACALCLLAGLTGQSIFAAGPSHSAAGSEPLAAGLRAETATPTPRQGGATVTPTPRLSEETVTPTPRLGEGTWTPTPRSGEESATPTSSAENGAGGSAASTTHFTVSVVAAGAGQALSSGLAHSNGHASFALSAASAAQTVTVPLDTYVFVHGSAGQRLVSVSPASGVLVQPLGRYHLPRDGIALLHAVGAGIATITLSGTGSQAAAASATALTATPRAALPSTATPGAAPRARGAGVASVAQDYGWYSSNWSGYAVPGYGESVPDGTYTDVTGNWIVPTLQSGCTSCGTDASTWIGIDGFDNSDLIQTGVDAEYDDYGDVSYTPWWEILPADETPFNDTVEGGDQMHAEIKELGSGEWNIELEDVTQGWTAEQEESYSGEQASAEWILEAPEECYSYNDCQVVPLAEYGETDFLSGTVNGSNPDLALDPDGGYMEQNDVQVSTPSEPDATYDGFAVEYGSTMPSPPSGNASPTASPTPSTPTDTPTATAIPATATPTPLPTTIPSTWSGCNEQFDVPASECQALAAFYAATDGPEWGDSNNWELDTDPCDWYGVECTGEHVSALSLSYNNLTGAIPPALGNLPDLTQLELSGNSIGGGLPAGLGNLTSATYLDLQSNDISGSMPLTLDNLTQLSSFYFDSASICEPANTAFEAWFSGIASKTSATLCPVETYGFYMPLLEH